MGDVREVGGRVTCCPVRACLESRGEVREELWMLVMAARAGRKGVTGTPCSDCRVPEMNLVRPRAPPVLGVPRDICCFVLF